ncbi:hypothetical protein GH733_004178 [Mirounga leonina]|nr:hypothetical protein GH733_004178 [Mirounga leonina]
MEYEQTHYLNHKAEGQADSANSVLHTVGTLHVSPNASNVATGSQRLQGCNWVASLERDFRLYRKEINKNVRPSERAADEFRTSGFGVVMFLQYYLNEQGDRVYTLKKLDPMGQQTCSAHPARFSPDDKYSRHRITVKKRFKIPPPD